MKKEDRQSRFHFTKCSTIQLFARARPPLTFPSFVVAHRSQRDRIHGPFGDRHIGPGLQRRATLPPLSLPSTNRRCWHDLITFSSPISFLCFIFYFIFILILALHRPIPGQGGSHQDSEGALFTVLFLLVSLGATRDMIIIGRWR